MKKRVVGTAVVGLISVGVWFTVFAQQPEPQKEGGAPMQMGPKMMQQVMAGMTNNPMMAPKEINLCQTMSQFYRISTTLVRRCLNHQH